MQTTHKIGDLYPVWWDTFDGAPAGQHQAVILDMRPYEGRYPEFCSHVLKLTAPRTRNGWLEMTVDLRVK